MAPNVVGVLRHLVALVTCTDDFLQSPKLLLLQHLPGSSRLGVQAWHGHTVVLIVVPAAKRLASSGGHRTDRLSCIRQMWSTSGLHEVLKDFFAEKQPNKNCVRTLYELSLNNA